MGRYLGDFTAAVEEHKRRIDPAEFEVYGEKFHTADDLSGMPFLLFSRAAVSGLDTVEVEAAAAQMDFIISCVADKDQVRFIDLMKRKRASVDGLMTLARSLVEQFTGGPTLQPSDSDGGLSTTTHSSSPDSSSPVPKLQTASSAA